MTDSPAYPEQNAEYAWVDDPDFQDWLNELMRNAPECCWDDDVAMTSIATDYVRFLEGEVRRLGGNLHRDWCVDEYFTKPAQNDCSGAPDVKTIESDIS